MIDKIKKPFILVFLGAILAMTNAQALQAAYDAGVYNYVANEANRAAQAK